MAAPLDKLVGSRYSRFSTMERGRKIPSPLSPAALQILAALATEDLHGYGIIQRVSRESQDRIRIGPGTLYDNLKRFMEQGWVRDLPPSSGNEKRMYRLTAAGKAALSYEISRLDDLVRQTKRYLQGMKPRSAE
jgi:DNA-binding PadR family transcriptional regulator